MPWTPPPSESSYYALPSPSSSYYLLPQLLGLTPSSDPTYGRSSLPFSPSERALRDEYTHRDGKAKLNEKGTEWCAYQVWEPNGEGQEGQDSEGRKADLVHLHGVNDYAGKFSEHARFFLDDGFRVIVPDLPTHGRSTGVHVCISDLDDIADAVYAVMTDVLRHDHSVGRTERRKTFVSGQSLGGYVAVRTCVKYGAPQMTEGESTLNPTRPQISGGIFLCPMLAIAGDSRPSLLIEYVAKSIAYFAGALPLASANRGKNSEDTSSEEQFLMDPQTYHGKLRVATGLAMLKALTAVEALMPLLKVPFSVHHGTGDRVTSHHGSEKLFELAASTDKKITLYPDYEHILLRKGKDEKDDERRQNVLSDWRAWLRERC